MTDLRDVREGSGHQRAITVPNLNSIPDYQQRIRTNLLTILTPLARKFKVNKNKSWDMGTNRAPRLV